MTQGYMLLGLDREDETVRLEEAHLTALTLKLADPKREVAVMLRDTDELPEHMEAAFDYAIQLPYDQLLEFYDEPRIFAWQPYYCTPFDETVLITQPALALSDMDTMWIGLETVDLAFGRTIDFQGKPAQYKSKFVRQQKNNITGFNCDVIFFRKSERAAEFFKMADPVFKDWTVVYDEIVPEKRPPYFDFTLVMNTVAYLLGENYQHVGTGFEYTDLDPDTIDIAKSEDDKKSDWTEQLSFWFDGLQVKVNNHNQFGLFVYHDPAIITQEARDGISQAYQTRTT